MRILVTGGCGFIGSNFIKHMLDKYDYQIYNIDKLTYAGNSDNLINIENDPRYKFVKGDICNRDFINKIFHDYKPITIVHFAAESEAINNDSVKDILTSLELVKLKNDINLPIQNFEYFHYCFLQFDNERLKFL